MIYGYKKLTQPVDWEEIVGTGKWRPKHSAYELAHKWHGTKALPPRVRDAFKRSEIPAFQSLSVQHLFVEHPTFLDTCKAPSCTDIMGHCRTRDHQLIVLGVEGKAREPFGQRICEWIKNGGSSILPTRKRRLEFLGNLLGVRFQCDSRLRYQLVHRTASVVHEASLYGAVIAVVLVHSFAEKPESNWQDFRNFLRFIKVEPTEKDSFAGPIQLGLDHNVTTYFIWIHDEPT